MSGFIIDADIAKAKTLSTLFYTHPRYFEEAREKIFAASWQFIGHTGLVSGASNCFPFYLVEEYINEPLLLTRDSNNKIHCLSNVCTHRGNILVEASCSTPHIRCRYHGRRFGLDGTMTSMPEFKEVKDFPSASDHLVHLPLYYWGNWLFTSLDTERGPELFFREMRERLSWLPVQEFNFRPELSRQYQVSAHWSLYCENYLEGFHIPFIHAELNTEIDYGSYQTELFRYSILQVGMSKGGDVFDIPSNAVDHGKKIAAYYFFVFPNMMFNFYPWGLSVNIVQPVSATQTKISFYVYMWKDEKYNRGAGSDLDKVEMEDEEIIQQVQKGIRSRFYNHGRYSVTREQGTHHFHRLIAEFMN